SAHTQVAVAGKPNVGKSSLINAILNKEKLIVSAIPGTTRDSTDSFIRHKDKEYNFIDTAGLKRPGKTQRGIERFSALRSMAAIERCDVALMVLDSSQPVSHQDQAIASYIIEAGKGLIILANKWDIPQDDLDRSGQAGKSEKRPENSEEKLRNEYIVKLKRKFPFLSWAPVVFTSAVTKKNMHIIFEQIDLITKERKMRITTAKLNTFMEQLVHEHRPTGKGRTHPRIYYITQPETEPPKFIVFVNKTSAFHFSYVRYIENRLREKFTFTGTPIKIEYREKERL
ncbi:MAG: GTPase, partial [Patescibacteria group bacterium]